MKNSNCKNTFTALALIGGALAIKKMSDRKRQMRAIMDDYGIRDRSPFGFADKIREMSDEDYASLKERMRESFASHCCNRDRRSF